jgi:cytochrome c
MSNAEAEALRSLRSRLAGTAVAVAIGAACPIAIAAADVKGEAGAPPAPRGEQLARSSDCFSCHTLDHTLVGPPFDAIAQRYRGQPDATHKLAAKIKYGGSGNWGAVPMTPHPDLKDQQLAEIVTWVLSLHGQPATRQAAAQPSFTYKAKDGSTATLDFPLRDQKGHVSAAVFSGWEQFNSYCFRCHGEDATGSAYAPDLRTSLRGGMTRQQFAATTMAGRPDKGMPKWAGFFTPQEVDQIYDYVKGRSVGLVPAGRPDAHENG